MTISATLHQIITLRRLNRSVQNPAYGVQTTNGNKNVTAPSERTSVLPLSVFQPLQYFPMGMMSQRKTLSLNDTMNCVTSRAMKPRFQREAGGTVGFMDRVAKDAGIDKFPIISEQSPPKYGGYRYSETEKQRNRAAIVRLREVNRAISIRRKQNRNRKIARSQPRNLDSSETEPQS